MKKFLIYALVAFHTLPLFSQGGFTYISSTVEPDNPITQMVSLTRYRGAAWIDVNGDGKVDLFAAPNFLFINKGNGKFESKTLSISLLGEAPSGVSWADFDNDGDADLLLTKALAELYLNDGLGNLTNNTAAIPNISGYRAWGCAFGDYNNDSKMDFIYVHPAGFLGTPQPCKLYKQTVNGIQQVTGYAITSDNQPYTVPFWSDFDQDGDLDLFVASGPAGTSGLDFCYQNMLKETGRDTFIRMTQPLFASELQDGQTYNFIDIDNDGDLDLCLTNYGGVATKMYRRNADASYTKLTAPFTNKRPRLDNAWGDFDNDGDLDVILTSDSGTFVEYYENDGLGNFTINTSTDITKARNCSGVTLGDYDNDGDLDVFINGDTSSTKFGLYKSTYSTNGNKWINFKCKGTASNRSAIGTKVRIKATIDGNPTWQIREILAQNTFQGQNDLRVHFGLKAATKIDSVEVVWLSGKKDVFINVLPNQFYQITEGGAITTSLPELPSEYADKIIIYPNPTTNILFIKTEIAISADKPLEVYDMNGKIMLTNTFKNGQLNINSLPNGEYFLRLYTDQGVTMKKFLKQR